MNDIKALEIISNINKELNGKEESFTKEVHERIVKALQDTNRVEVSNFYAKHFLKANKSQIISVYLNALVAACLKSKANEKGRITLDCGKVKRIAKFDNYSFTDVRMPVFDEKNIQLPNHWLELAEKFDTTVDTEEKAVLPRKGDYRIDFPYVQHLVVTGKAMKTYEDMKFALENIDRVNEYALRRQKLLEIKNDIIRNMLSSNSISNAVDVLGDKYLPHVDDLSIWNKARKDNSCMGWLLDQEDPYKIVVDAIKKDIKNKAHHTFNMDEDTICIEEWRENGIVFYVSSHSFCNETDSHDGYVDLKN